MCATGYGASEKNGVSLSFWRWCHFKDLHDSLHIMLVWLGLPLASWLQELDNTRDPCRSALESLAGNTASCDVSEPQFSRDLSVSMSHMYLHAGKICKHPGEFLLQHQAAFKQQHICIAQLTSHQVYRSRECLGSLTNIWNSDDTDDGTHQAAPFQI